MAQNWVPIFQFAAGGSPGLTFTGPSAPGTQGPRGQDAAHIYNDHGDPRAILGVQGDYYIDRDTGNLWQKLAIAMMPPVWQKIASLKGAKGDKGDQGVPGGRGADGAPGPAGTGGGGGGTGANPTALVGLTAVNGAASTFIRSDGAPAIDQTIVPTWSGKHTFTGTAYINGDSTTALKVEFSGKNNSVFVVDTTNGGVFVGDAASGPGFLFVVDNLPPSGGIGANGRSVSIGAQAGGSAVSVSTGGNGGPCTIEAGPGGDSNALSLGTNTGGVGGDVQITAGGGGGAQNGSANVSGNGGNVSITSGTAGTHGTGGTNGGIFIGVNANAAPVAETLIIAYGLINRVIANSSGVQCDVLWGAIHTDTVSAGTFTFDMSVANRHICQLASGGQTLAVSNVQVGHVFELILQQPSSGAAGTVTWFSGILWPGGAAPVLTATNSKYDVFNFECISAGVYLGFISGQNF